MAMVNDRSLVVGFLSEDALPYEAAVLAEMRQRGADVLALTPTPLKPEQADYQARLPSGYSDMERSPLYLPVLHLLSYYQTLQKGLNPDKPNNLNAVVSLDGANSANALPGTE